MKEPIDEEGLSTRAAEARLREDGPNELPGTRRRSGWTILREVVSEPMFLLLIGAASIYLALGDRTEALTLFASVFVVIGIGFYQAHKTERALEALRDLSSPRALVIRDGQPRRVAGREVVRGDLLMLAEGDRIAADARVVAAHDLMADESLLTGESVAVGKRAVREAVPAQPPGGENGCFVFCGTLVTRGQGVARVTATGPRTEVGRIGRSLAELEVQPAFIQRETRRAVLWFGAAGLVLCGLVFALYVWTRGHPLEALLAGVTLAMANLPEELPLVVTVFLALGAWRIAQHEVLTRRAPAIETLGATSVLCVDKTGTLTQNRMTVRALWGEGERHTVEDGHAAVPDALRPLVRTSMLASEIEPFDPMERAFLRLEQSLPPAERLDRARIVREYAFTPERPAHVHVWRLADGSLLAAAKGAPETMAGLCGLAPAVRAAEEAKVEAMATEGLRVLAVAAVPIEGSRVPETLPAEQGALGLQWLGLIGLEDPIRPAVPGALRECRSAGIRTVMITGDYPATARAIAERIGLAPADRVVTGTELAAMDAAALARCVAEVSVFARVRPEQKLDLVRAFKAAGAVVAMTGDGVNDAPALKAADIGVAMGERGTDVAREAAALVLLKDDFASLVRAVRQGRRIYDNVKKAMAYIVAVHVPTAGMALLPLLFGWPLLFFPVHIVFLEFIIDPACSIVFEAEPAEKDVMHRPPRPAGARLFGVRMLIANMARGLGVFAATAALYGWALGSGAAEGTARAMAFATVVFGNLGLILEMRGGSEGVLRALRRRNAALWWVFGISLLALALTLWLEPLRALFRFGPVTPAEVGTAFLAALAGLVIPWVAAALLRHRTRRGADRPAHDSLR